MKVILFIFVNLCFSIHYQIPKKKSIFTYPEKKFSVFAVMSFLEHCKKVKFLRRHS